MQNHGLRNIIIAILVLGILAALAILSGAFRSSNIAPEAHEPLTSGEMTKLIPRGRELTMAGDCLGCHSQPQGPQAAGGVGMATPFGTIYSTNITPDKEHGIGHYSRADFHRVLRDGIAPEKGNLYPAMPFVFTHITKPDDIDAIYAYIMSLEPLNVPNKNNTGVFKLPVRPFMNFWALLNFPDRQVPSNSDRSDAWDRGAYLVEGLAHCGACHTPRNIMMGVDFSRSLQGGELGNLEVPDITAEALAEHGFDVPTLSQYLQTGIAPQGTTFSDMHTVSHFSTSAMEPHDVNAMSEYLLTDGQGDIVPSAAPPAPLTKAGTGAAVSAGMEAGKQVYLMACAGCHGANGEGIPNVSPAMKGNGVIAMEDPHNTITVVLNGLPTQLFSGNQRMYAMPPFAHELSDEEVADLVTWVRAEWGGQAEPVTLKQVEKIERAME